MAQYSNGITTNYLIQWTLIGWVLFITGGIGLWGCQALNMVVTLVCFVLIEVVSYLGSQWKLKVKSLSIHLENNNNIIEV